MVSAPSGNAASTASAPERAAASVNAASPGSGPLQPADAHVVRRGHRPVQGVLQHDGDPLVQRRGADARRVDAVPGDDALVGQVEPGEQLGERRLAGTVLADQRDHLAAAERERHVGERGLVVAG
jgi:hypothetical protein